MRATKSDITLDMDCWVEELSPAQLAAYEKVANEHNAIKGALKSALNANEGKELFNGQVFQAYSFKGKVLQELKEATLPKKPPKAVAPPPSTAGTRGGSGGIAGRKRAPNFVYLESSDEEEDDVPLAKRIATAAVKKEVPKKPLKKGAAVSAPSSTGKASPLLNKSSKSKDKSSPTGKGDKASNAAAATPQPTRPSEVSAVGGLAIGSEPPIDPKEAREPNKETKLQGKTFPSLVVIAKPWLKVKDMSATRSKLDSKVKLVLMLTPNKFCEWLLQEGLLKSEQKCANHSKSELKLGVYSDASKFPYTGGYVWISECCPLRFVSVFHGSIFEAAANPPSCILKLIYHWSCQTNIQNVVQWVKVDNVYIKGVYTWLRAICTLATHQKCKKLGGPDKYVEVGVISLGTTSQDGQQRQVKVEVLGVLDFAERTIRLRAVEPVSDVDRNYKKRFQTILEPLTRWVHKESIISIDLTVDKITLHSMGFKNIVQAAATDNNAKHNNSAVMDYLRRIVPRMFQNTLSLLSRQMIQQFLDELVWREHFGTYALQAFNNITTHIAEQTRINTSETLTQRLYQVATNPFKDWSVLPANYKETPANNTPKRLKKPINDADYVHLDKVNVKNIKKEKDVRDSPTPASSSKRRDEKKTSGSSTKSTTAGATSKSAASATSKSSASASSKSAGSATSKSNSKHQSAGAKNTSSKSSTTSTSSGAAAAKAGTNTTKKLPIEITKVIKKEEDELKGLEEMYYGVCDGFDDWYENFPYKPTKPLPDDFIVATTVECPICDIAETFDSNEKLQTHLVSHVSLDGREHQFQCLFCLEKHETETVLAKHNQLMHATETKFATSPSYHCLICQQRFNSLHLLTLHLGKVHNVLELPYTCHACGYRSSSHRDVVRHYYDDHKNQNFLQCPFCLDIFRFSYKGRLNSTNIENYYMHLRQHVGKRDTQLRCQKCALSFIEKGALRQHVANHHQSMQKSAKPVRILLNNSLLISPPKVRTHRDTLPFSVQQKLGNFYAFIDGSICAECNAEILNEEHYPGLTKCNKCNYKTCCERAMFQHTTECNGARETMDPPLPNEMHCVCGFSTAIGNKMAEHLASCGQKSAYPTVEMAQENTVKRNMLDMLGLVRRDGETGADGDETDLQQQQEQTDVTIDGDITNADMTDVPEVVNEAIDDVNEDEQPPPIQFGEMEATPVVIDAQQEQLQQPTVMQDYEQIVEQDQDPQPPAQYTLGFGNGTVAEVVPQHALTASDIDMPLIGELADPNPPPTPQFLGEVHTPMFDAVAAAEQQHYHQMLLQQQQHHHNQQ